MLSIETKTEVKTYIMDVVCPKCGVGKMRGKAKDYYQGGIPHECTDCRHPEHLLGKEPYPRTIIEHVPIELHKAA